MLPYNSGRHGVKTQKRETFPMNDVYTAGQFSVCSGMDMVKVIIFASVDYHLKFMRSCFQDGRASRHFSVQKETGTQHCLMDNLGVDCSETGTAVPLPAMVALGGRGGIAATHS
jgi:hypothetical protein